MKKVKIYPGACGLVTHVTAEAEETDEGTDVHVIIDSACPAVRKMAEELGDTFDAYEVCLAHPGENLFYQYAKTHFPGHAACPTIAGIIKCIEAEAGLALPKPVQITFE